MISLLLDPKTLVVIVLAVAVGVGYFLFPELVLLVLLGALSFLAVFSLQRLRMPFDVTPVLVLSLLIVREFGLVWACVFVLLGGVLPTFIGGGSVDVSSLLYIGLHALTLFVSSLLLSFPFFTVSLMLIVAHHVAGFFIGLLVSASKAKEFVNLAVKIGVDAGYLLLISRFLFLVP